MCPTARLLTYFIALNAAASRCGIPNILFYSFLGTLEGWRCVKRKNFYLIYDIKKAILTA